MKPQTAANGTETLAQLTAARESPVPAQLFLLDTMIPEMSELEVPRRITEELGEAAPGILILTSAGQSVSQEETSKLGIERTLTKQVKPSDLLDAISKMFGTSTQDEKDNPTEAGKLPRVGRPMKVLLAEDGRVNQMVPTDADESASTANRELKNSLSDVTPETEIDIFDGKRFRTQISDRELRIELIDLFPKEAESLLNQARHTIALNEAAKLHAAAHSLKGSVGTYCAPRVHQAATVLDDLARSRDLTLAVESWADCEREVERLRVARQGGAVTNSQGQVCMEIRRVDSWTPVSLRDTILSNLHTVD